MSRRDRRLQVSGPWARYGLAAALPLAALSLESLRPEFFKPVMFFLFYPATLMTALFAGFLPALLSVAIGLVCVSWLFGVSAGTPEFLDFSHFLRLGIWAGINALCAWLIARGERLNAALRRSERRLRIFSDLAEYSSDFIRIADPDGTPFYVNPAGRRMVGLSPDHPVARTAIPDYHPPSQHQFVSNVILKEMKERGHWKGETFLRHWGTGEAIPVSADHFLIREPATGRLLGLGTITRDISDLKRLHEQIREAREFSDRVLDLMPCALLLKDARDLRIVRCNNAAASLLGLPQKSIEGRTCEDLLPKEQSEEIVRSAREALADGDKEIPELPVRTSLGDVRFLHVRQVAVRDPEGRPTHLLSLCQDVTERRRLQEASQQLATIIESSEDAIISYSMEGIIASWNRGAERLYGYTADEAMGKPLSMLVPPDLAEEVPRILRQMRRGERVKPYETARLCKAGMRKEVSLSVSPIRDRQGHPIRGGAIARDITELKRVRELQEAVIAMTSHELSNPLTTVSVVLKMLAGEDGPALSERHRTMVRLGISAAGRMNRMISDFLTLEKLKSGTIVIEASPVDLRGALQDAARSLEPAARDKGVALLVQPMDRLPAVLADGDRLLEVAINLISNAVKFTPAGGSVSVSAEARSGGSVRASISDEGPGIPQELRPRLFGRFARAKGVKTEGSGLGLSISKAIVDRLGGRIGFESRPQGGTTFYFELNSVPEAVAASRRIQEGR